MDIGDSVLNATRVINIRLSRGVTNFRIGRLYDWGDDEVGWFGGLGFVVAVFCFTSKINTLVSLST
ncbi:uncharacterized protein LACBIDRAFT_298222 [Laccaria bicolor S238N-H82]|uniref:Predicted protein n=1 Tax=Laccaria bicolor (strain S238N-H82 / ATCC MYA-4686) TaxID=486041 RepID=B0DCH8_LACBS|nr:uncharacterized protein LACBIDRAFT_298222 [Laccaria bicolor S238N-H82]EDR07901.1 predicted protein [Laccaria bicolor S238N-H82]|eukprot:XP_001881690.1 predicted protein [Laccaria bicolor S238N-H82]